MYIWRKRVAPDWLRLRGEDLENCFGAGLAVIERAGKRRILLEVSCRTAAQARELVRDFGGKEESLERDWFHRFTKQAQTKTLRIGSRLIFRAAADKSRRKGSARTIIIPAETAFGTGEHATTAMCLRLLERQTRGLPPGWSMLDAGTGSGILAIAARCLGAARVFAIDNDPLACAVAERNARANRVGGIQFRTSDVLKLKLTENFDVITGNLFSELLINALPRLSRRLAPGGFVILSGILRSQEKPVAAALRRHGFALQEVRRRGKWIALLAGRRTAQRAVPT